MIDKSGLQNFISALSAISTNEEETRNEISQNIAETVGEIANSIYQGSYTGNNQGISIDVKPQGNGKCDILASGTGVYYAEFGTGIAGEQGNYEGELPKDRRVFKSRGAVRETDGYVYNYYKKLYNKEAPDWKGFAPIAGMWKAGIYAREHWVEIAKKSLYSKRK